MELDIESVYGAEVVHYVQEFSRLDNLYFVAIEAKKYIDDIYKNYSLDRKKDIDGVIGGVEALVTSRDPADTFNIIKSTKEYASKKGKSEQNKRVS